MSLPAFGVRKPVVANLVMVALIGIGVVFGTSLRREFFPEIRPNEVVIAAPYPGASPEEVEKSLAIKIEDRVGDLDDVVEMNTTVTEGLASIRLEFAEGVDADDAVAEVKREIDALQDLPEEAERITVVKIEPNLPVIILSLYADAPERILKEAIREIEDDLRSLDGMGDLQVTGVRADEIRIEVSPGAILEHRMSLAGVSDAIRRGMAELPGGSVKSETVNVPVRTLGAADRAAAVRDIVVRSGDDGRIIRVSDVAEVLDAFEDAEIRERLNGKKSVSITIFKVGHEDAVEIAEMVKAYVAGRNAEPLDLTPMEKIRKLFRRAGDDSPVSRRVEAYELGRSKASVLPGELALTTDLARFIVGRLNLLTRNALWGGILVFATLILLLNVRTAFWAAIGLVVSLLGTLAVMSLTGITLNLLTMFGLIVVLGLLVDDAIVVAENITSRHERGESAATAAINGAVQVAWPVVATVLTTICAFLPLALIEGSLGDMLAALPMIVAVALLVSLIEALFILPSHMAHSLRMEERREKPNLLHRLEQKFDGLRDRLFLDFIVPCYLTVIRWATKRRYTTIALAIAVLVGSAGMVAGGRLPFILFEASDSETVIANLQMPIGTPVERTDDVLARIERAALAQPETSSVFAVAGYSGSSDGSSETIQPHLGQLFIELKPVEVRQAKGMRSSPAYRQGILDEIGEIPGIKSLRLSDIQGGPEGPAISLTVTGRSTGQIDDAVARIERGLAEFAGVHSIANDADRGQRELRLTLRDGASELGFTVDRIAREVRGAVFGLEAHTFAGLREDVDVRVTLPRRERRSLAAIESMYLISPRGQPVPLREVVRVEEAPGYATIRRLDRNRAVTVSADVRDAENPEQIMAAFAPVMRDIQRTLPGVRILQRGRQQDFQDSLRTLPIGMLVACGLIFVILAWLFESYAQPLIVMTAVPFAIVGVVWGHLLMGYNMTFLSMIGFIALAGVVVNDSLIFMQFFNEMRAEGLDVREAAVEAGKARIRAIILTTVTTVLGLSPLMLERSFQAKFLIPMAITISFGLISATALVLVVLPALLVALEDAKRVLSAAWHGRIIARAHAGPADPTSVLHPEK
jgi:multidrug efflux pump subunit AcrB